MRTLHFPTDLIREYYSNDFGIDLRRYFEVKPLSLHKNIAFIGHLDWHFNPQRKCDGSPARRYSLRDYMEMRWQDIHEVTNQTEKNFLFAGLFYFIILVPQTLRDLFGEETEYDFYRCTGWPLVSAGLGGYLSPEEMLREATLMPNEVERENFHRMLSEIVPFMNDEISRFFRKQDRTNLHEEAYNRMLSVIGDKTDEFLSNVENASNQFRESFHKL